MLICKFNKKMRKLLSYILLYFFASLTVLSQSGKPVNIAIQSLPNSPHGVANSDVGYWNNPSTWSLNRIPTHGDSIIIPNGITVKVVLKNQDPGTGSNRLSNVVVLVQNGGGLTWYPVIPGPAGQGEKLFMHCNSTMIVEPLGWLWGDQVGDKISWCNSFVWSANGLQNFGPYFWGNPLPVEFLFFNAQMVDKQIEISWGTASETNNDYFILERADASGMFYEIARIRGAGNSNVPEYYKYNDIDQLSGTIYYRLWQYDFDGRSELLSVTFVNSDDNQHHEQIQFKNPVASTESVDITLLKETAGIIRIISTTGEIVQTIEFAPGSGRLNIGNLKSGLYVIVYQTTERKESHKLLVL